MCGAAVALWVRRTPQGYAVVGHRSGLGRLGSDRTGRLCPPFVSKAQRTLGGKGSGFTAVGRQFSGGSVTFDPSCRQDIVGDRLREVAGCHLVIDRTVTGHVQQGRGSGPARSGYQQVGLQGAAVACLDGSHPAPSQDLHNVFTRAGIKHGYHLDPSGLQVGNSGVTLGIGAQNHRSATGLHGPEVDEAPNGTGEHYARDVVAGKDVGPFNEAGGHDQGPDPGLDQAFGRYRVAPLHDSHPVVVVAAGDDRVAEDLDAWCGVQGLTQVGQHCQIVRPAPAKVTAELGLLFNEHDGGSGLGCGERRRHSGRPASGYKNVGVGVALVVVAVGSSLPVDAASRGELTQDALVEVVPQELWAHEGLVVEAGREEASDQLIGGAEVPSEAGPHVLGTHLHAIDKATATGPHVRFVANLDRQVRVPVIGRQDSPAPVVLHSPREDLDTCRSQGRGDGVALMAAEGTAVPGEREAR